MIYLILCIVISVAILTVFRSFPKYNIHKNNTIVISYLVSFLLSFLSREKSIEIADLQNFSWFYWGLFIGFTFFLGFQLFAKSTSKIGMAITSVSGNTSVVIPVSIALLYYSESASLAKISGIFIVLLSFILIFKKEKSAKINWSFIYLPIMLFFLNGTNAALMGFSEKIGAADHKMNFMMIIFFAAFIVGLVTVLFGKNKECINSKTIIASVILGGLNFGSTVMILKSLEILPNSIFFPVYNTGYIILSALFGFWIFKEKLLPINWVGIAIATGGIILLTSGL